MKFTHKGWFLFSPIYLSKPDSDNPELCTRSDSLIADLWFFFNEFLLSLICLPLVPYAKYVLKRSMELRPFYFVEKLDQPIYKEEVQ